MEPAGASRSRSEHPCFESLLIGARQSGVLRFLSGIALLTALAAPVTARRSSKSIPKYPKDIGQSDVLVKGLGLSWLMFMLLFVLCFQGSSD